MSDDPASNRSGSASSRGLPGDGQPGTRSSRRGESPSRTPVESPVGSDVAWFGLQMLSFWTGVLVAAVVLVRLLADLQVQVLSGHARWSPSRWWGIAGVVHLGGAAYPELLFLSVPSLATYLYRRHVRIGRP